MRIWSRFGQLLHAEVPQERALSGLLVLLAIAYVGLSWVDRSSACAEGGNIPYELSSTSIWDCE